MKTVSSAHGCVRPTFPAAILVAVWMLSGAARADERAFSFGGATLTLNEATAQVDVYFQSLRFNRAIPAWNVEVTVSNKSAQPLSGPLALVVDSFSGTTGPQSPDGFDDSLPPKSFFDLSGYAPGGGLLPGEKTSPRTLTLGFTNGSPNLVTRFYTRAESGGFAAAATRALNDAGQPLPGAQINETGPQGSATHTADSESAIATIGQGAGNHVWKFSAPGFLPVWRQATLTTGIAVNLPSPRLTPRGAPGFEITPVAGGQLSNDAGSVKISFPPGSFSQSTTGAVTSLNGQTLPGFLPQGWSPMQAFWLELGSEPSSPGSATLTPAGPLNQGESAAFTRWNPTTLAWDVLQILPGNGANPLTGALPGSGAFALVVADTGALAPPPAVPGSALPASVAGAPNPSSLVATGSVSPAIATASLVPELVTAAAQVIVSNRTGNLPSGLLLRCEIADQYLLRDGSRRRVPQYDNFIIAYQRPGDAHLSTLHANFPLRPVLLFAGDELDTATIRADVLTNGPFAGGILNTNGGQVVTEDIRILAGTNDVIGTQAVQLRKLNPTNFSEFSTNGIVVVRAFDLALGGVMPGRRLQARFETMPANQFFVLARVLTQSGITGLEPRERLIGGGGGALDSLEPTVGERLPGITGSGQYLLLQVPSRQGLVTGLARNALGQATGGLAVQLPPWLTFSATDGSYRLIAPTGAISVAVTDLATGDTGVAGANITDPQTPVVANPSAAQSNPAVLAVSPAPGATAVPRVATVTVTFTKAINPATLPGGLQLLGASNQPVAATLALNLKNTAATLLPIDPLAPNTLHTISLSTNVTDFNGRNLSGPNQFSFTTATDNLNRPAGAQVISHEPINGLARMEGTQGIADPNAPVILVNETSGRTATVLARPDGGFTNFIQADVNDFLSAVLVNQNGTRTTIPVTRQIYADGRVGLFSAGGTLAASGVEGKVSVTVPPGAIARKTVFRLQTESVTNVLAQFGNVSPTNGTIGASVRLETSGEALTAPISVTLDIRGSRLPVGVAQSNLVVALMSPRALDGVTAYEFLATGTLVDTGPVPFSGEGASWAFNLDLGAGLGPLEFMSATVMDTSLYSPPTTIGIAGTVQTAQAAGGNNFVPGTEFPLASAVVTVNSLASSSATLLRFQPGEVYAVSDSIGHFSLIAPQVATLGGYAATATHPRFPNTYAASPALGATGGKATLRAVITFEQQANAPDVYPPAIFASHTPQRPQPGSNAVLTVFAVDDGVSVPVAVEPPPYIVIGAGASPTDASVTGSGPFNVTCSNAAKVVLILSATDAAGNKRRMPYSINFGGAEVFAPEPFFEPNTNDTIGPYIIGTLPPTPPISGNVALVAGGVGLRPGDPIVIRFNEPMARSVEVSPTNYLTLLPDDAGRPTARLHEHQRDLHVTFPALRPNTNYEFTVQGVTDVSTNILDLDPTTNVVSSFAFRFRTAPQLVTRLPATFVENGGGAVVHGIYAYVLERAGPSDGALVVLDLSSPTNPVVAGLMDLPGYPRDLALIPHYSFKRGPAAGGVETHDLIAVVGGKVAGETASQYLYIISITNPASPNVVASALVSPDPTAIINRVAWSPPNLALVENRAEYASVHLVELQTFIFGRNTSPAFYATLPPTNFPGLDANFDGDFVDLGDTLPLPGLAEVGYPGRIETFTLDRFGRAVTNDFLISTTRTINDAAVGAGGSLVGVVAGVGVDVTANPFATNSWPGSYRSHYRGQDLDGNRTTILLTNYNPKRVLITDDIQWPITNGVVGTNILISLTNRTLAMVVSVRQDNSDSKLTIVDATVNPGSGYPGTNILMEMVFAVTNVDLIQAIARSDDGRVLLATTTNILILDPKLMPDATVVPLGGLHRSVVGTIHGAAAGATDFSLTSYGLGAASLLRRTVITQLSPDVRVINGRSSNTNNNNGVVNPVTDLPTGHDLAAEIMRFETPLSLDVATNSAATNFLTINPRLHHQVMVRAPGSATNRIALVLDSLDGLGRPLVSANPSNVPPPSLANFTARRVSDNPTQPEYNFFLSPPFVLVPDLMPMTNYVTLTNSPMPRHFLLAGYGLRASLSPSLTNHPVLGEFASKLGTIPAPPAPLPDPAPPPGPPVPATTTPSPVPPFVFLQPGAGGTVAPGFAPVILSPPDGSRFTIETVVDQINSNTCPGSTFFRFTLPHPAVVSMTVRPDTNVTSAPAFVKDVTDYRTGTVISNFYKLPFPAGTHTMVLSSVSVGEPGEHLYELVATNLPNYPSLALTNRGLLVHNVRLNNNFPVAHTIIEGVDLSDGHLSHSQQDVMIPGRRLSLEFSRSYGSSGNSEEGPLGAGWTHNYNCRVTKTACGVWTVVGGEGSGNSFQDTLPDPVQDMLEQRYAPLLADRTDFPHNRYAQRKFLKPQIGYHSAMVIYPDAPTHIDFFTKSGIRYHFVLDPYAAGPDVFTLRDIREPNGNYLVLNYHPDGDSDPRTLDLVMEVDANGQAKRGLQFEYLTDTNLHKLRISRITGTNLIQASSLSGLVVNYSYDSWGNLTNVTREGSGVSGLNDTRVETYEYTPGLGLTGHNLIRYVDPNGRVTVYGYDPASPPPATNYYANFGPPGTAPVDTDTVPPHEVARSVTRVADVPANDVVTRFDFVFTTPKTTTVHSPRESEGVPTTKYVMNEYGATLEIQAPLGQTTKMKWATDDHLNRTFDESTGAPGLDALMVEKTDAEGRVHEYYYEDGRGNLTKEIVRFLTKPVTNLGGNVTFIQTTYAYHPLFNQRTNMVDAEGNLTSWGIHPTTGNVESQTDAENQTTIFQFAANGDLEFRQDPRGFQTKYQNYDHYGNAEKVIDGENNVTDLTYDDRSRLLTSAGAFKHSVTYTYDGLDRKRTETRANLVPASGPGQVTGQSYLPNGLIEFATNGLGHVTRHIYDALNRKTDTIEQQVRLATGALVDYTTHYTYDRDGNLVATRDPRGIVHTNAYDALNRRIHTAVQGPFTPASLTLFTGQYDRMNNLTNETDLHGYATAHVYDGLYRVIADILPFEGRVVGSGYDVMGNKVTATDANGKTTAMSYDRVYRLKGTTNAVGIATVFSYDGSGNKTNEYNTGSKLNIGYAMDGLNRPRHITKTVPLGGPSLSTATYQTDFAYDDDNNTVTETNPRGFQTETVKDSLGRAFTITVNKLAAGNAPALTTTYKYDANGNQLEVTDAEDPGTPDVKHEYDGINRRTKSIYIAAPDENGVTGTAEETFLYDADGNLTQHTDKRGVVFNNTYDNLNRPLEKRVIESLNNGSFNLLLTGFNYDDPGNSVTTTDANGNPTVTKNDELGRTAFIMDALGKTNFFGYDGVNKIAETDRNGQRTEFFYDAVNRLTNSVEKKAGGTIGSTTQVKYEDTLNLRTETDRNNFHTIFQMDALGRLVQRSRSDTGTSPNSLTMRYSANPLLMETREYDGNGNNTLIKDGNGNRTAFTYDGADRRIEMIEGVGSGVTATNTYTYDNAGNLLAEKGARGNWAFDVRHTYDDRYRRSSTENAEGEITRFRYDENNNLARKTDPLDQSDPGRFTEYWYDELNKLVTVDESSRGGGRTLFLYDNNRNKLAQQDANNVLVTYQYDGLNRLTNSAQHTAAGTLSFPILRTMTPGGGSPLVWSFGYDPNGNQTSIHDPRDQLVNIVYDWLDRPIARVYANHAETNLTNPIRFQPLAFTNVYDGNGNLLQSIERKADGLGGALTESTSFQYDPLNRPASRTRTDHDGATKTNSCRYDVQGNRTAIVDPDAFETLYSYDARNRLTHVVLEAGTSPKTNAYTWWEDSLLKRIDFANGAFTDRSGTNAYDKADRVKLIENRASGNALLSSYTYAYDGNGNRTNQTELQAALGAPETTSYAYDKLDRLIKVIYGTSGVISNTYALNGNRLNEQGIDPVSGLPVNRTYSYAATGPNTYGNVNALTRITDSNAPAKTIDYEYDANLNQIARVQNGVRRDFRFDIRDQIAETTQTDYTTSYDYNADRLRVKKVDPIAGETRYLYDQSSVLVEYAGAAGLFASQHKYDYGYSLLAYTTVSPSRIRDYYMSDGLRSTANLTDDAGLLKQSYRYDAWGRVRANSGPSTNPRQYTGHYKDTETGLHYFGARYYDDEQARFLSQDPYLGEANTPPSLHRYLYAYANPLRYVDLTGYAPGDPDELTPDQRADILWESERITARLQAQDEEWKAGVERRKDKYGGAWVPDKIKQGLEAAENLYEGFWESEEHAGGHGSGEATREFIQKQNAAAAARKSQIDRVDEQQGTQKPTRSVTYQEAADKAGEAGRTGVQATREVFEHVASKRIDPITGAVTDKVDALKGKAGDIAKGMADSARQKLPTSVQKTITFGERLKEGMDKVQGAIDKVESTVAKAKDLIGLGKDIGEALTQEADTTPEQREKLLKRTDEAVKSIVPEENKEKPGTTTKRTQKPGPNYNADRRVGGQKTGSTKP